MNRTTLKIEGMSCGHCVASVKKALTGLDGVTVETVAVGSATVAYDPAVASEEEIAGAIRDAGYTPAVAATSNR
jgi:copper chaperone